MGQTQQQQSRTAPTGQGFHPLRKTPLRCLSADINLYQKGVNFLAHTVYPVDAKSPQLLIENDRYYAHRAAVVHGNLLGLNSYDFVEGSSGASVKGSLGNLSKWGEQGRKTNVNALCSLSIFDQHCKKILPASSGNVMHYLNLHLYHEYQGHTLQSQIEMRKQCEVYFQEKELWTLIAAASSAGKMLIQNDCKEPVLSPTAIKIDCNGGFKVGEWEFAHFYEEMAEDEEETNFYEEGETFLQPASSRIAQQTKNRKKSYNILTNYYWAPEGTAGLQKIVTLGRKGPQSQGHSMSNQIFSLGMTILHTCLMRPLYQSETFSEKKINAYIKQASTLRNNQKMPLSSDLMNLLGRMLAWDAEDRIGYVQLSQVAKSHSQPQSQFPSQNETPLESGTFRSKLNPTKSLLFVEGKDSGIVRQGFGDSEHPLEQSQKMNVPCTMRQECSLNYEKIDFTIKRERRQWQKFENRIEEDSYKVKPSSKLCTRLFPPVSTFSSPAEQLMQDGEDSPHLEMLCINGTNERQNMDVECDSNNVDINCTSSIEQSIKLLDISNIKAQDQTKEISKQRHSHIRVIDASLSNLFAEHRLNTDISKEDSMLLKSSVTPHNINPSIKNQKDQSLFTPPELMALIRSSVYNGQSRRGKQHPHQTSPPMIASQVVAEGLQQELSNSVFVKESFAKGYYEGGKVEGLRSGYGTFYYRQGGKYCGDWDNNQMHGKGTLYYADGRIAYQGDWSRDSLKGKGILYNEKPVKLDSPYDYTSFDQSEECWVYYEGNFHDDDKWGRGVLQLSNGERFEGSFKNDLIDGRGVFYTMDGRRVIGDWEANQLVRVVREEQIGQ